MTEAPVLELQTVTKRFGAVVAVDQVSFTVQPGEVFLAGRVEQSLDSRYFGPVRVAHLTAQAVPLLTWR